MNVGITGHRYLEDSTSWAWVESEIERIVSRLPPPLVGITCLAIGADQLLAAQVSAQGGHIRAIIPFADYERTFSAPEAIVYRAWLARSEVEVLRTGGTDEDAYLSASCRVVALADLLLAVWDERPARGKGGTADVVGYARQCGVPCVCINPLARTVNAGEIWR